MFTIYSIVEIIKHRMLAKLSWKNKMIKYKESQTITQRYSKSTVL